MSYAQSAGLGIAVGLILVSVAEAFFLRWGK